jgi:hypothetical protein
MCLEIFYKRRCGCKTDLIPPTQRTENCNQFVFTRSCTEYVAYESNLIPDGFGVCRACITWQYLPGDPPRELAAEELRFYTQLEKTLPEVGRINEEREEALKISEQRKIEREERLMNLPKHIEDAREKLETMNTAKAFYNRERYDYMLRQQFREMSGWRADD